MRTCLQESVTTRQPIAFVSVSSFEGRHILHVSRTYELPNEWGGVGRRKPCDHDGREFASSDEAFAFALDRGYCQPFFMGLDWRARRTTIPERSRQLLSRERSLERLAASYPTATYAIRLDSLRRGGWVGFHRLDYAARFVGNLRMTGKLPHEPIAAWARRAWREAIVREIAARQQITLIGG